MKPHTNRHLVFVLIGLTGLLLVGCMPTPQEAGAAVMAASPLIVLSAGALMGLLWLGWRKLQPAPFGALGFLGSLAVSVISLTIVLPQLISDSEVQELTFTAWWAAGTSYLVLTILVWRIWWFIKPQNAFADSMAAVLVLYLLVPAAFLLWGRVSQQTGETMTMIWIVVGYAGFIAGPVYGAASLELAIRLYVKHRDQVRENWDLPPSDPCQD